MYVSVIEKHLKAIDQATFQTLMNHLLFLKGYKFIGALAAGKKQDHARNSCSFTAKNHKSKKHVDLIFNVVVFSFEDQKLHYFKALITINPNPDIVRYIMFEKGRCILRKPRSNPGPRDSLC